MAKLTGFDAREARSPSACKVGWILLWAAGIAVADSSGPVSIEIINNFPVIPVAIVGESIPVAFDLGGDNQIELTSEALKRIEVVPLPDTYAWLNAKGNRLEARKFRIPELRIGNSVFRDVVGHEDVDDPSYPKTRAGLGRMGRVCFSPIKLYWTTLIGG